MTYVHESPVQYQLAVHAEIKRLDATVSTFPTLAQLESYWDTWQSVEKAANDWIDYYYAG